MIAYKRGGFGMRLLRFFLRSIVVFSTGFGAVLLTADHIPGGQVGGVVYGIALGAVCIGVVVAWSWDDWPTDP